MTTVKTTCPNCGDIELGIDQVMVIKPATYLFVHCDAEHQRSHAKSAGVLEAAGATVVDLTRMDEELRSLL
jgi:hypothetical protein